MKNIIIYKNESLVIFYCIIIILLLYLFYILCNQKHDQFRGNYSDSKRNKLIQLHKDDDSLDPDDDPNNENDPDS